MPRISSVLARALGQSVALLTFVTSAHAQLFFNTHGVSVVLRPSSSGDAVGDVSFSLPGRSGVRVGTSIPIRTSRSRSARRTSSRAPTRSSTIYRASNTARVAAPVLPTAERYIGTPYVWGGTTPDGFDCSGFVQYVYRKHGVGLPRTSRQMAEAGRSVRPTIASMRPGDLMLFEEGGRIGHVAIYAGDGLFIHSSSSGKGVRYDRLDSQRGTWFANHLVKARRVSNAGRSLVRDLPRLLAIAPLELDFRDRAPAP